MEHTKKCLAGGECNCTIELEKRRLGQMNEFDDEKTEINMGEQANAGKARDDSTTSTRLLDKHWSPLIVRKYQMERWPMYIGMICDANLNDLDEVVHRIMDDAREEGFVDGTIQGVRNTCGLLTDEIANHYDKIKKGVTEGVIVCWYVDKMFCSSASGDFMTHNKCAMEFYQIINTLPHI